MDWTLIQCQPQHKLYIEFFPSPFVLTILKITSSMGSLTFYNPISALKYKTTFCEIRVFFCDAFDLILCITVFNFLQTVDTITSKNLIQHDGLRCTQLLASHYDCSEQYNLRQSRLIWVQRYIQDSLNSIILEIFCIYSFWGKKNQIISHLWLQETII